MDATWPVLRASSDAPDGAGYLALNDGAVWASGGQGGSHHPREREATAEAERHRNYLERECVEWYPRHPGNLTGRGR